ncbi:MAG: YicC/YloC family endoribonuclease [Bacillota bacterium]|nr:YicC/YloC family endoribonuclease [Bacillota bacterium]
MRSMTGYGRGQSSREGLNLTAEIKTVNHRYLDISVRLPKSLLSLEVPLRKRLAERFARGRIDLSITQDASGAQAALVSANLPLAHEYAQAAQQVAAAAGVKGSLKLNTLLTLPEVLTLLPLDLEADTMLEAALEALNEACDAAEADRAREGEQLRFFFNEHIARLDETLLLLADEAKKQPLLAREKLEKRLSTIPDIQVDQQRLAQEIALFADRCDITEEITRLKAHTAQMKELLLRQQPSGRDMDFLAQEMNREANTICSKSSSLEVTRCGLICKSEIDKIREQIQNVE